MFGHKVKGKRASHENLLDLSSQCRKKKVLAMLFMGKHGLSARLAMYGNKIIAISFQVEELTY